MTTTTKLRKTVQIVTVELPGASPALVALSRSNPGKTYPLTVDEDGLYRCSCHAYQWRRRCSHTTQAGELARARAEKAVA